MAQFGQGKSEEIDIETHLDLGKAEAYMQAAALDLIKKIDPQSISELDRIFDGSDERLPAFNFTSYVAELEEQGKSQEEIHSSVVEYLVCSATSRQPRVRPATIDGIKKVMGEDRAADFRDVIASYIEVTQKVDAEAWEKGLYRDTEDGSLDTPKGRIVDIGRKEMKTVIAAHNLLKGLDEDGQAVIDFGAIDLLNAAFSGSKQHVTEYDFEAFVADQQEAGTPNEEIAHQIVQTLMSQFASDSSPVAHNSAGAIGDVVEDGFGDMSVDSLGDELKDILNKEDDAKALSENAKDFIKSFQHSRDARQYLNYDGIDDEKTVFANFLSVYR